MSNQKQYKRTSNSGDYQITGENSNGINISKDGNTYLYTGNNEEYLEGLREGTLLTNNNLLQTNDPNNAASFIGMYKTGGSNINLGNPNQQSLNINTKPQDNKNIVTPVPTPPSDCDDFVDAVLIGGLDNRVGDYNIKKQRDLFKEGFGKDKKVEIFRFNNGKDAIKFITAHPKTAVLMFSAGCEQAEKVSKIPGINKEKIYIAEPYGAAERTRNIVQAAVKNGVPRSNVFAGSSIATGKDIITNPSLTNPDKKPNISHWDALKIVGKVMDEKIKCNKLPVNEPTPTPTPTPTPAPTVIDTNVYEDIQDLNFIELPEDEGFQLLINTKIEIFEEANENETNKPAIKTNETITQILIKTKGGSGGGNEIPTKLGTELNIIPGKVGASPYPGPPDFVAAGYKNAYIPLEALVGIAKGAKYDRYEYNGTKAWHLLHPEAASQYFAFKQFADSQNIKFTISSAYRDYAHQVSLGKGSTIATPGSSPHGWGGAIDIRELAAAVKGSNSGSPKANAFVRNNNDLYKWFAANAPKFGFYNPYRLADNSGVDEVWHWEYWGFYVK